MKEGRNATHIDDRRRRGNRHEPAQTVAADLSGPAAQRSEDARRSRQRTKNSRRPISPTSRRSRRSAKASTASCISAAIRSKAPGTRSCSPTSSAATICSRRRAKRASSAWCSRHRTMRSASIRAITASAPTSRRGPTAATASARCSARRSARSMPTSTGSASPASGSAISATSRSITAGSSIWLKPEDLVQLCRIGLDHPDIHFEIFYGASYNERAWWDNHRAYDLGYRPTGRGRGFSRARHGRAGQAQARSRRRFLPGRRVLRHGVRRRQEPDRGLERRHRT